MVELDTQIVPAAHAMSFLFWACSAFKVSKESYVTGAKEMKKQDNRIYEEAKAIMDKIPISGVNAAESDTLKKLREMDATIQALEAMQRPHTAIR